MSSTFPSIEAFLKSTGTDYEIMDCDPALADTKAFCEHYNIPFANSANAILIKAKKGEPHFTLCVLLATHRLDVNHSVRKKMGAKKVSFATAEETIALTGMEIGGVTPVGLPRPVPIWVDEAVMQCDYVILGGGNRVSKLKVAPHVLNFIDTVEVVAALATLIDAKN